MDSWLWDTQVYEDEIEDNFSPNANWQPDFGFWHDPDPIENDIANEQACIQVLRILITKADTDITELEEDILFLQSQLAWTDEAWSELCFIALREKIKFLEMTIKRLKNVKLHQGQQEGDVQLQVDGEPAEEIHAILKRLLEKYSPHKDEQHESSNVENPDISQSMDETRLINAVAEVCGVMTSEQTTMLSCLEAQEDYMKRDEQNKQNKNTIIPGQLSYVSSIAFEEPNQRDLDNFNAKSNREQATSDHDSINKAAEEIYTPENDEQAIAVLRKASGFISSYGAGSNSRIWGSSHRFDAINTGLKIPRSVNECTISNSLPKLKKPLLAEPLKLADVITNSMPDALGQLTNNSIIKPRGEEDADRASKTDPQKQLVTMGKIGMRSPELKKNDEHLDDRECIIAESLGETLNKRKEASEPEKNEMPISQILEQMQNTEVTVPNKSKSNLLLRSELEQKPSSQLESQPCLAAEMKLKPSSIKDLQGWKSMIMDKNASNTSGNRNFRGQAILDFGRNRSPSAASDTSMTSDSQSEKKRKHSLISPDNKENKESVNIQKTSGRHKDIAHGMIQKDNQMSDTKNEANVDKPLKSPSGSDSMHREPDLDLEFLPKDTLRKLAKVNNLTGYSKLRKEDLIKLLKEKSREGDWREI